MNRSLGLASVLLAAACGESIEPPTVMLEVRSAGGGFAPATTDLGYTVDTWEVRVAAADLELTIEGEQHADKPAFYHPGHSAGGDVTGSLPGPLLIVWDGMPRALGTATLITGDYHGVNLGFRSAGEGDGLAAGDALLGHTFHVTGEASRDGVRYPFDALLDLEAGTALVGGVFEASITESTSAALVFALAPTDPTEQDTLYDGHDFAALAPNGEGVLEIRPGSTAHNVFRRPIQTHDHYVLSLEH
jgi:hypothetical protein